MGIFGREDAVNNTLACIRSKDVTLSRFDHITAINRLFFDDPIDVIAVLDVYDLESLLKLLVNWTVRMSKIASQYD
jgi:hypothetical protein